MTGEGKLENETGMMTRRSSLPDDVVCSTWVVAVDGHMGGTLEMRSYADMHLEAM
jgi:hypothetical protein